MNKQMPGRRISKKPTKAQLGQISDSIIQTVEALARKADQHDRDTDSLMKMLRSKPSEVANRGDMVVIGFVGRLQNPDGTLGDPQQGMVSEYVLIDSLAMNNELVPGFEEQLIGASVGSVKTVTVTFPENYAEHLRGKTAQFQVGIQATFTRTPANTLVKELIQAYNNELVERSKKVQAEASSEAQ
jgi:trigger factor